MTLPTHKQLMMAEIAASKALSSEHIASELAQALKLREVGFPTQAFLHLWIVTEVAAKELMCIYKYTKDTHDALPKLLPELNRALRPHITAPNPKEMNTQVKILSGKALPSMVGPLQSIFKAHAQSSCRQLDIAVIKAALVVLEMTVDHSRLEYLLATKVKTLPVGIDLADKTTVRERRNKLVHSNGTVGSAVVAQLLPIFDEFFSLLQGVSATPPLNSSQPDLDKEVAQ